MTRSVAVPLPSTNGTDTGPRQATLHPLLWHALADAALHVDTILWLVGPPGSGKTTYATDFALRHSGRPPFELQGTPNTTESSFWGHREFVGETRDVDGPLAAAVRCGGVFVLNDVGAVPTQVLSTLLPLRESRHVLNPVSKRVLDVPSTFRVILASNPENYRCRQGQAVFHSLLDGCLVLNIAGHATAQIVAILSAQFPALERAVIEQAVATWERFANRSLGGVGPDDNRLRLSLRAARQYLRLIEHGAREADAAQMAFLDKFCHDPDTHEAMRMKHSLGGAEGA